MGFEKLLYILSKNSDNNFSSAISNFSSAISNFSSAISNFSYKVY